MVKVHSEVRPWGRFEKFIENQNCTVKLLHINSDSRLSLQYHRKRREFWRVIKGSATVQILDKELDLKEGENIIIPKGASHRITTGKTECIILELSFGEFDENDIVRIQDDYGRDLSANKG